MATSKFLDKDTGLPYFWQKLKLKFNSKIDKPSSASTGQILTYDGNNWAASDNIPILPIDPSPTPTTPGAIWIETS